MARIALIIGLLVLLNAGLGFAKPVSYVLSTPGVV